jgi:hypothetical protein
MTLTKKELLALKEEVEDSKVAASELKGQQTALLKQLKDDFGCDSLEEAEEKLKGIDKTISILDKKIKRETEELEAQFETEEKEEDE